MYCTAVPLNDEASVAVDDRCFSSFILINNDRPISSLQAGSLYDVGGTKTSMYDDWDAISRERADLYGGREKPGTAVASEL